MKFTGLLVNCSSDVSVLLRRSLSKQRESKKHGRGKVERVEEEEEEEAEEG